MCFPSPPPPNRSQARMYDKFYHQVPKLDTTRVCAAGGLRGWRREDVMDAWSFLTVLQVVHFFA